MESRGCSLPCRGPRDGRSGAVPARFRARPHRRSLGGCLPLVAPGDIPIPPGFQQIEKDSVLIRPLTDDDSTEASTLSSAEPLVEGSSKSVIR